MTTISDAVRGAIQYQLNNVHTVMPATFISFNSSDCSASVKPSINKNYLDGTSNDPPIIHKVPVLFPVAGQASITFPINAGDYCLLVFCERSTEEWKRLGINEKPLDRRKFDLSDAIAIPGLLPFTQTMPPVNNDLTLRFGGSEIRISNSGDVNIISQGTIRLDGNSIAIGRSGIISIELISQIQSMITAINTASTTLSAVPTLAGGIPAWTAQTTALNIISNFLESIRGDL